MSDRPIDFRPLLSYNRFEVDAVDDYKEKFITLFQETTKALLILREAQQDCIQAYVSAVLGETQDGTDT